MSDKEYRDDVFDLPFTRTIGSVGQFQMTHESVTFTDAIGRKLKLSPAEALAFFQTFDDYRDQLVKTLSGETFEELEETAELLITEYQ